MSKNYRALTRTYRPQSFEDIVSQEHVSSTLKNAIKQNRLSHAYMFCGPRGVGKTTMARVLARTINSIGADVDGESLNQTLNIVEIDAASNNKVDDIHHLRETVRIPPQNGRYKVFIIDEVHMLSKQAFNALLKTLEEPPEHAIFIFATTEPHKVLPTILSRVQRFDFKRIAVDEIVSRLKDICRKEEIQIDEESLHVIAKKADGALRDALGLMDQAIAFCGSNIRYQELLEALNVVGHDQLFDFTAAVQERDSDKGLQLVDSLLKDGADIQEFLTSLTEHIRNMYVAVKSERMYLVDATADTKNRYKEAAQNFTEEDLMRMLHLVSDAQIKIRDVQQPRVHFEILLLKLVHMNRTQELSKLMGHLEELKKKDWNQPITQQEKSESPEVETPKESEPAQAQKTVAESTNGVSTSYSNTEQDEKPTTPQTSPEKSKGPESDPEPPTPPSVQEERVELSEDKPASAEQEERKDSKPTESESKEEDEDEILGKPTLGYAAGISSSNGATENDSEIQVEEVQAVEKIVLNGVDDLEEHWPVFLEKLKDNAPRMLYFQVQRVKLKHLKGSDLTVTADNEFAINLFEENQQLISSLLKQVVGVFVRISCIVERDKKKKESLSPFERFKEIQKKDPHLKSVVDLFGAELEY
ncbi:MAG: DNA polymerase III subunit gamma/tau [Balneolaceae bacterium]